MSNESKLYWLTRLDSLQCFCVFAICIAFIAILLYTIFYTSAWDDDDRKQMKENYGKYISLLKWLGAACLIIAMFLPSRSEAILIVAGGKTLDFVQSDTSLSKIPEQTTAVISKYLDEQIKKASDK